MWLGRCLRPVYTRMLDAHNTLTLVERCTESYAVHAWL